MQKYFKSIVIVLLLNFWSSFNAENQTLKPKLLRLIPLFPEDNIHFDNGYVAGPTEIPYIVGLDFTGRKSTWFCAGSIIHHRWIVTVASCTNPAYKVKINFGVEDRVQSNYSVRVSWKSFFTHPSFNRLYYHDIALIHMPYINYSKKMKLVSLPKSKVLFTGDWTLSSGWGQHRGTTKMMNKLHVLQVRVIPNANCSKIGYGKRFQPGMICGQLPNMDTSCRLDSGSPMVLQSADVLIGIASFGNQIGCRTNTPLGYTRITAYKDWITSVIDKNEQS